MKIGNKVKLIKYGCNNDKNCCETNGYRIGKIYTIEGVSGNNFKIKSDDGRCSMNEDCFELIPLTLKDLIGED